MIEKTKKSTLLIEPIKGESVKKNKRYEKIKIKPNIAYSLLL